MQLTLFIALLVMQFGGGRLPYFMPFPFSAKFPNLVSRSVPQSYSRVLQSVPYHKEVSIKEIFDIFFYIDTKSLQTLIFAWTESSLKYSNHFFFGNGLSNLVTCAVKYHEFFTI